MSGKQVATVHGKDGTQIGGPVAVGCDAFPDESHIMCRQINGVPCGWHCANCGRASSYQGHLVGGRTVDGKWRRFADGELRLSCEDGIADVPLEEAAA